jgi:hypothetical protein
MKIFLKAALAVMLIAPCATQAATDGTLGATSSGTFGASLTINSPAGVNVQVFGLDDFAFGTVTGGITTTTTIPMMEQPFCISRSNAGNVLVTFAQIGSTTSNFVLSDTTTPTPQTVGLSMVVYTPAFASGSGLSNGSTVTLAQSGPGCTAASTSTVAHTLRLTPASVPAQATAKYGSFSGTFSITVSPQ